MSEETILFRFTLYSEPDPESDESIINSRFEVIDPNSLHGEDDEVISKFIYHLTDVLEK